jgi:hypothetical protein
MTKFFLWVIFTVIMCVCQNVAYFMNNNFDVALGIAFGYSVGFGTALALYGKVD